MSDDHLPDAPCPTCGAVDWIPIAYGEAGDELLERAAREEVILGACVTFDDAPAFACRGCGLRTAGRC